MTKKLTENELKQYFIDGTRFIVDVTGNPKLSEKIQKIGFSVGRKWNDKGATVMDNYHNYLYFSLYDTYVFHYGELSLESDEIEYLIELIEPEVKKGLVRTNIKLESRKQAIELLFDGYVLVNGKGGERIQFIDDQFKLFTVDGIKYGTYPHINEFNISNWVVYEEKEVVVEEYTVTELEKLLGKSIKIVAEK